MNNQEIKTILKTIGLKQEEGLLKWLFKPFWGALTGTITLLTVCLVCTGVFVIAAMFAPIVAFGIYMSCKCRNRLREIEELI